MNYIGKVLNNFRDFYNDINAATLTGAIDVVVVEQPDGTFTCSPFHVRFGKLGVLRSREKVVDIEVNGEPLDIHMKLGESGEAFFVEEIPQSELEACPAHLACSPIPSEGEQLLLAQFGNRTPVATSPSSPDKPINESKHELFSPAPLSPLHESAQENTTTDTPPQPRTFRAETVTEPKQQAEVEFRPIQPATQEEDTNHSGSNGAGTESAGSTAQPGPSKNARRKKRRKSMHKKKQQQMQQKKSSPGANGGDEDEETDGAQHSRSATPPPVQSSVTVQQQPQQDDQDETQFTLEDVAGPGSRLVVMTTPPCSCKVHVGGIMLSGSENSAQITYTRDCPECARRCTELGRAAVAEVAAQAQQTVEVQNEMLLCTKPGDLHFFSDTEASPSHSSHVPHSSSSSGDTTGGNGGGAGHDCVAPDLCDPYWAECSVLAPVADAELTPHGSRAGSPTPQSDSELEMRRQSSAAEQSQLEAQLQAELGGGAKQSWKWGELPSPPPQLSRLHSTGGTSEQMNIELADEQDKQQQQQQQAQQPRSSMLSGVWSLMRIQNRQRAASQQEGVYLDELDVDTLDPEVAALYFPHSYRGGHRSAPSDVPNRKPSRPSLTESVSREEEDTESGKGPSLSQSPHSVEGAIGGPKLTDSDFEDLRTPERKLFPDLALSLCGPLDLNQPPSNEAFSAAVISHAEFRQNPSLLEHPALVVRMHGRLQTWREAAPEVLSLLIFQQPLTTQEPSPTVAETNAKQEVLTPEAHPKESEESQVDNQVVPASEGEQPTSSELAPNSAVATEETGPTQQGYSWFPWRRSGSNTSKKPEPAGNTTPGGTSGMVIGGYRSSDEDELAELTAEARGKDMTSHIKEGEGYSGSNSSDESETGNTRGINIPGARLRLFEVEGGEVAYRKSLRLSSEQIGSLMLKEGANEVVFSVTTAYQGTSRCKCHVYRWRWDDKIVISDIDGTITKSDVLGHILPIVGKDWAQSGVAQLFTKIKNNGYRLLYLSARAIGQARVTREYLKSIKQGDLSLPEGPLLLSPTSLISAFHREVIEKKPEEFKISCLRDIQALFPPECKPFYAGYGNKINDVWAYRAVGIPIFRIFTINHKGELKHELTQTFQSSYFGQSDAVDELFPPIVSTEYSNMSYIVDQMFPPTEDSSAADDYNSFNYWREPIPELDPALLPPAPASPTAKGKTPLKESPSAVIAAK